MAIEKYTAPVKSLADARDDKNLKAFHTKLRTSVKERVASMLKQIDEHRKNGSYKYQPGDRLKSPKTGDVWHVDSHMVGSKGDAQYLMHTGDENSGHYASTMFRAEPMHKEGWEHMKGPTGVVKK